MRALSRTRGPCLAAQRSPKTSCHTDTREREIRVRTYCVFTASTADFVSLRLLLLNAVGRRLTAGLLATLLLAPFFCVGSAVCLALSAVPALLSHIATHSVLTLAVLSRHKTTRACWLRTRAHQCNHSYNGLQSKPADRSLGRAGSDAHVNVMRPVCSCLQAHAKGASVLLAKVHPPFLCCCHLLDVPDAPSASAFLLQCFTGLIVHSLCLSTLRRFAS